MDTLMTIQVLMMMFLVGVFAFFAGQMWESGRKQREARKEVLRRLTKKYIEENE